MSTPFLPQSLSPTPSLSLFLSPTPSLSFPPLFLCTQHYLESLLVYKEPTKNLTLIPYKCLGTLGSHTPSIKIQHLLLIIGMFAVRHVTMYYRDGLYSLSMLTLFLGPCSSEWQPLTELCVQTSPHLAPYLLHRLPQPTFPG